LASAETSLAELIGRLRLASAKTSLAELIGRLRLASAKMSLAERRDRAGSLGFAKALLAED